MYRIASFIFQPRRSDDLQFEIRKDSWENTCLFSVSILWTEYESELESHQTCSPWGNGKKKIYLGHRHKNTEVRENIDIKSLKTRPKSGLTWLNLSLFNLAQLLAFLTKEHLPHLPHNCSGNGRVCNCNTLLKQRISWSGVRP